jgi:23S rRNA pseudouridine2605 synthase
MSPRMPANGERRVGLARALSKLGMCSRSRGFDLVREGRVALNGGICRRPESPVRLGQDRITIDGRPVEPSSKTYLVLNKPRGIVTTASDEKGRETVYSCLPAGLPWVAPVGRLDKASEGLLLLTNDSEWGARLADPRFHLPKTYHVQIASVANDELLQRIAQGVRTPEGDLLRCVQAKILRIGEKNSWLEIVLEEGKNRQIRRMMGALGVEVLRLVRVAIGPLQLGDLPKGQARRLTPQEKHALDAATVS